MITLCRNEDRRQVHKDHQDLWLTFLPRGPTGAKTDAFGILAAFDELRLAPGAVSELNASAGMEMLTYVYRGSYAQQDSAGSSGVVHAGEFQRMVLGIGVRRKERNPSLTHSAQIFRMTLHPSEAGLDSSHEQMRFPVAQRHNLLCIIASQDGRKKSLKILQDVLIYSSILDPGQHIMHELLPGRSAWLHVIRGEVLMQDVILKSGDGVGVTGEPSISITARDNCEILLIDLGPTKRPFVGF